MSAYLIVRADVDPSVKEQFDTWYEAEHLPDAMKTFSAVSAKRGWSEVDENVHIALYEFPSMDAARAVMNSDALKGLIAEFDRHWEGQVTRSREFFEVLQAL